LQFNVGSEDEFSQLRHCVAFSFEKGRNLPSLDELVPKVARFNEFMRVYPDAFADLEMWHFVADQVRSDSYAPGPIPPDLIRNGYFVCLGRRQPASEVDLDIVLADFDRLLPVYRFVEQVDEADTPEIDWRPFQFRPGHKSKASTTTADYAHQELDLTLRHNDMQEILYRRLVLRHGAENVGTEHPTGLGTRVDAVVRTSRNHYSFYEIKTRLSARACIREALGQLLEYAYWPGAQATDQLIVIGEPALDEEARTYLAELQARFSLPVSYEQASIMDDTLQGSPLGLVPTEAWPT
jgi:hypothetical protein